jgi:hypothetical protein
MEMPRRSSFIVVGWLKMLDEDGELMSKRIDRGSCLNWFGRWSLVCEGVGWKEEEECMGGYKAVPMCPLSEETSNGSSDLEI